MATTDPVTRPGSTADADGDRGPGAPGVGPIPAPGPVAGATPGESVKERALAAADAQAADEIGESRPRAHRVAEGAMLGGVCTGLAKHLGWPVMVFRVGFVALLITQFIGVIAYGALWLLMPPEPARTTPGLSAADRQGLRTGTAAPRRGHRGFDVGALVALVALGAGLLWIVQISGLGISQRLFWPVAFACAGAALVWRQADTARQRQWKAEAGGRVWLAPLIARGGWPAVVRTVVGLGLVGAAFGIVIAQQNDLQLLPEVLAMTVLALAGLAIVLAPWLHRSRSALNEARAEKVRADARADMAAHLHDSVLQTLALIQRQADDPKAVQQIARRQERELRTWLYGDTLAETTLKAGLTTAAAEVEDERGVPVELVMVGDAEVTDGLSAMIRAAREAMVNAAKHSGAAKIDVYAEVDEDLVEIFVRDRGQGFVLDAIDDDRMGVRGSIVDRMERHGGRARIRSAPGEGTEVRLEMER
ncbi:signal transduction histidine kinase/phage shock protein PspC (stress-responsive transcriptional regulator) [Friedmanniella endophytica]|uniref:Signal transduction histidine kinase/phage shock protein PspC (Stress-responsive transcriptional regulator) n=1 Tax=Microlunatus kandeliicorticis TaxID=1759536 RepID=A0A7W3IQA6_9ACTN|nr:ATP-binding protein [Microlunatus kandeliicorticis]MBA8793220.1 signal transduction histidine kinase/phage shock protein PspC (stress-responsive transcriptional regulator) [Microlunatus kandeliicorticis]